MPRVLKYLKATATCPQVNSRGQVASGGWSHARRRFVEAARAGDKIGLAGNPQIAVGLSGLGAALKDMADKGIAMKYDRIRRVLGEGNFVLVASEGSFAGKPTVFYDLFRVDNGKIAEHWDTIETVPPKDQWKNDNGKF